MLERHVQYGYVAYIGHIGHVKLDYRTADHKLDIEDMLAYSIAGPEVMLTHM